MMRIGWLRIRQKAAVKVIPPRSNRKAPRKYDKEM